MTDMKPLSPDTTQFLDAARRLAKAHRETDPTTTQVYLAPDPQYQEIRLVEVSTSTMDIGEVLPYGFSKREDLGIPYPSVVVLLSPREWEDVKDRKLNLPAGWGDVRDLKPLEDQADGVAA